MEFTATETTKSRMLGLSHGDSNPGYADIDYALYPSSTGALYVYEKGVSKGQFGTYASGDKLRVAVEGGQVKYRRNGTLLYASASAPQYPLSADTSFFHPSATVTNATIAAQSTTDIRWVVADHLGTARMTVDRTGSLTGVSRHDYLPFGEELAAGVGGRTQSQGYSQFDGVRQGFTAYEKDGETGLNFAQARYYASTQGRFTSVDPLEPVLGRQGASDAEEANKQFVSYLSQPQRWNRYVYCLNNPLRHVDPDGFDPITVNLNIIFDRNANYSAEEKLAFANSYVAQAQKDFGNIEVTFNVTYTEGTATNVSESNHAISSGTVAGAINAFVTRSSVGPAPEVTNHATGTIWISTGRSMNSQSPGNLTHGIIHALGIFPGVNGYDRVDHSGTRHDIIRKEIWNALTGNSAESATQSLQGYLRGVSMGPLQGRGNYPPGVTLNHSRYKKEISILRQGAQKYLGRTPNRPR